MSFYPQLKVYISPSALQAWHNSRSMFIRSYFMGEKTPETSSMRGGTMVHKLIEMGLYPAKKVFERNEKELVIELKDGINVLGKPDSFSVYPLPHNGSIELVDYKTGKEDGWSNEKVATDLKVITTAWLVLQQARAEGYSPLCVTHYLEYIPTEWDEVTREIRPVADAESVLYSAVFTVEYLDGFTDFIKKTVDEINEEYPNFVNSTDEFVSMEDVLELADIETQAKELEARADIIKERLKGQLEMGNRKNFESAMGAVYITEKKTYEYPADLTGKTESGETITLQDLEEATVAIKVAKKNYEMINEPKTVSRSVAFRLKKQK